MLLYTIPERTLKQCFIILLQRLPTDKCNNYNNTTTKVIKEIISSIRYLQLNIEQIVVCIISGFQNIPTDKWCCRQMCGDRVRAINCCMNRGRQPHSMWRDTKFNILKLILIGIRLVCRQMKRTILDGFKFNNHSVIITNL